MCTSSPSRPPKAPPPPGAPPAAPVETEDVLEPGTALRRRLTPEGSQGILRSLRIRLNR